MSQPKQLPPLSFAGLGDWEPYEGGGNHGFVPQEGLFEVEITALEGELAKDGVKGMVKVACKVVDTDVGTGTPLISRVIYSGQDTKQQPLVRQFAAFLHSTGTPAASIQQHGKIGTTGPIEGAIAQIVGRRGFVQLAFEAYNGQMQSNVKNWIPQAVYLKAKENNGHRGRKADQVNIQSLVQAQGAQGSTGTAGAPAFGGQPQLGGGQPGFAAGFGGAPGGQQMAQVANAQPQNSQASIPNL